MSTKKIIFVICLCQLTNFISEGWRPYEIKFTNVSAYSSAPNLLTVNSSMSKNNAISIHATFYRNLPNFYANVLIITDSPNGSYELVAINRTIDACELYRNPRYEPIVQVFYKALSKTGTFPKRCPITKRLYFIKDVLVDTELFPPTLPPKGCIVETTLMIKNGQTFTVVGGFIIQSQVILRQSKN